VPEVGRWSKGTGRGALSLLRRAVPLQLCKLTGREGSETGMWTRIIIIEPPSFDDLARFRQVEEDVFV
jgi:hypothetical protein